MSKEQDNKATVGRWFTEFWGNPWNPNIVDELGAPDILLQYSLHAPRRGREDVKAFMTGFREAFPGLSFTGAATSSPRAIMWWVVGWAVARTGARPSATSLPVPFRRPLAGRCDLRERPCFVSKTARSQRRSAWTMAWRR